MSIPVKHLEQFTYLFGTLQGLLGVGPGLSQMLLADAFLGVKDQKVGAWPECRSIQIRTLHVMQTFVDLRLLQQAPSDCPQYQGRTNARSTYSQLLLYFRSRARR